MTKEGDDYTQARRAFNVLLAQYGQSMFFVSRYVGGLQDLAQPQGRQGRQAARRRSSMPKLQRDALDMLEENVFSDKPFQFPPELLQSARLVELVPLGHARKRPARTSACTTSFCSGRTGSLASSCRRSRSKRMHDAEAEGRRPTATS